MLCSEKNKQISTLLKGILDNIIKVVTHRLKRVSYKPKRSSSPVPVVESDFPPYDSVLYEQLFPTIRKMTLYEKYLLDNIGKSWSGFCPLCAQKTEFELRNKNLRESLKCKNCGATNRKRQIAVAMIRHFGKDSASASLKTIDKDNVGPILVAEANTPLSKALKGHFDVVHETEYFGVEKKSGDFINGIRHEDLCKTSFQNESLGLVISSDVLEHIPDPYQAHREIHRILRPGGVHIFTVPFYQNQASDEIYAEVIDNKINYFHPPLYHDDPLSPEGVLVYRIFGIESLVKLEQIGFMTKLFRLRDPGKGIVGGGALIFIAMKSEPRKKNFSG